MIQARRRIKAMAVRQEVSLLSLLRHVRTLVCVSLLSLLVTLVPVGEVQAASLTPTFVGRPLPYRNFLFYNLGITTASDHHLWFAHPDGNLYRINADHSLTIFARSNRINDHLLEGPDGNLWFTTRATNANIGALGRLTTAGVLTEFPLPGNAASQEEEATTLAVGPDGNLWYIASIVNASGVQETRVGHMTTSGAMTEFPLSRANGAVLVPVNAIFGPDGALWFVEETQQTIGRVTTSGTLSLFPIPNGTMPENLIVGPDNALWFVSGTGLLQDGGFVGRLTTSGSFTLYPIPNALNASNGFKEVAPHGSLFVGPDGKIWFGTFELVTSGDLSNTGVLRSITTSGVISGALISTLNQAYVNFTTGPDRQVWFLDATGSNTLRVGFFTNGSMLQ